MIRQNCISLNSPSDWTCALNGIEHAFAHTWENCYSMHLTTGFNTFLYCFEKNDARIVCPISERPFAEYVDIVTPYGFSGFVGNNDCSDFPYYWKCFVQERGYVSGYIALNPFFENRTYINPDDAYTANSLYFLDLTQSADDLLSKLDRNRRRQLKSYEQISRRFIFDKRALLGFFIENYWQFLRRVNASPANYFSEETLTFLCNLENVFMVGAGEHDTIEAIYVFAHTPYGSDCLFNVALPEGRKFAVPLLWCGINYLKSKQIPKLNLGGGVREGDSIAQSKQRSGGQKVPFRCLKQIYNPVIFSTLCQQAKANPDDRASYFPPYACPSPVS